MLKASQLAVQEVNKDALYFPKYEVVLDTGGNSTNKVGEISQKCANCAR